MVYANVQEREEVDYQFGCATELQNAYARSCMELRPDNSKVDSLVAKFTAAGRYCVVDEFEVYCPSTDAFVGVSRTLRYVVSSEARALELAGDCEYSGCVGPKSNR